MKDDVDTLLQAYSYQQEQVLDNLAPLEKKETIKTLPLQSTALEAHAIRRHKKRLKLMNFKKRAALVKPRVVAELTADQKDKYAGLWENVTAHGANNVMGIGVKPPQRLKLKMEGKTLADMG